MKKWRLHPEPYSKQYAKGPHWRYCVDEQCPLQHVFWEPFKPITGQEIDLSYLPKPTWKQEKNR